MQYHRDVLLPSYRPFPKQLEKEANLMAKNLNLA